jgi:TonB family protein
MVTRTVRAVVLIIPSVVLYSVGAFAQDGAVKIIVNQANPTSSLSKAKVSELFLRKATTWDDGQPVLPVEQIESSPLRETFAREVLGMSASAAQQAASHRGDPPVSVATDREVLAYVRLKPGAIGYISASTPIQGVKVIAVGGRPGDVTTTVAGNREPIRVGSSGPVPMPAKVFDVAPEYPASARTARVEGTIELDILVGPNGTVEETRIIKSIPQLNNAAVAAVRQWRYAPTVINGVAVPVRMIVKVAFVLNG